MGPVLVKITEHAGEFDIRQGSRMRNHVVNASESEVNQLLARAGLLPESGSTLVVNVSSPHARFPLNHFLADLEIFNAGAFKK